MVTAAEVEKVSLDDGEQWVEFELAGHVFELTVDDALRDLIEIDERHESDPVTCQDCRLQWTPEKLPAGEPPRKPKCPKCDSKRIVQGWAHTDDVIKLIREKYGAPRCSRDGAIKFYKWVVERYTELKKKPGQPSASPTGSESTPASGAKRKRKSGSPA